MSIVVTASFAAAPGKRPELLAALSTAAAEVHEEEGCELYALHDAADGSVWLIEKWSSEALLDAHGEGEAIGRLQAAIAGLVTAPPVVTRMQAVPAGKADQGTL